ncbi:Uncharacterized membrane protein [Friedmanniella luteola]|uniref:Uncharacterized membrane protein n=1 Tax=Friedmanniella luteola TaxID=546871 RepID=A0A1H1L4Y6_9ACTN|nr:hypothetical protein [Friedmanniella luteola]SDR69085.1 Uncharacterized membrane protein [Friedmanniella luteola]
MSRTPSLTDRWRRSWFLERVELWLDPMPRRRRRAVLGELRANLDEATADVGLDAALAGLGAPRQLAGQYLEAEPRPRPRWNQGALAAGLVLGAWLYATLFYTLGMLDALGSTGTTTPARGSFLGTQVEAVSSGGVAATFSGVPWAPLVVTLLVFLLVGRAWHVLSSRRSSRTPR